MKRPYLLIYLLLMYQLSSAQNVFPANGNVGIGTTSPEYKLEVVGGDINIPHGHAYRINGQYGLFWNSPNNGIGIGTTNNFPVNIFSNSLTARLSINTNGNVGIGTTTPQSKLAVNGAITAQKVKVIQTGWPDFVFDSAYQLSSLEEIEKFIQQHKHLPDIPSSKKIKNRGLDLGEMQKKQMEKIEELTLYLIEQNKLILEQQTEIKSLNKRVQLLENSINQ